MAISTAARSLGERRAPAREPWRRHHLSLAPAAVGVASTRWGVRNGEGEKKWPVRVWGDAPPVLLDRDWRPAVGFDPTVWGRPPANQARSSPRGRAARAVSAARPSAAGPRAQARGSSRAETGRGPFFRLGPHKQFQNSFFLLFQKHFEYEFE